MSEPRPEAEAALILDALRGYGRKDAEAELARVLARARQEECEACAVLAETEFDSSWSSHYIGAGGRIAWKIRARAAARPTREGE